MTLPRITVVGAGPAGCAVAAELARSGFVVQLVAAPPARLPRPGENLPAQCLRLLQRAGVYERLESDDTTAWRAPDSEEYWGEKAARRGAASGWHIDRPKLEQLLLEKALDDGAELIAESVAERVELTADGCRCALRRRDGSCARVETDFVIDATGRRALVARSFGARTHEMNRLIVWQGLWEASPELSRALIIEAQPDGWSYLVPLPGGRISAGFATDRDLFPARPAQPACQLLGPHLQARLANCRIIRGPVRWNAHSSSTTPLFGPRWVAVGDAAMAFDPLAACGILFGFGSACYAAEAIRERFVRGEKSAFVAYTWALSRFWAAVQGKLEETYAAETRWQDSPFWARRQDPQKADLSGRMQSFSSPRTHSSTQYHGHILSTTC